MNLLFLLPQLPYPPRQGTTLRNWNIVKNLAARHRLTILAFGTQAELAEAQALCQIAAQVKVIPPPRRSLIERASSTLYSPDPDMALRLASPAMHTLIRQTVREEIYDWVQVEGIEVARYALGSTARLRPASRPRLLFDDHNAEYLLQKSAYESDRKLPSRWHAALYSLIQSYKLARYEREVSLAADAIAVVSQADARALAALDSRLRPAVIPNGVDAAEFAPQSDASGEPVLVFTGKMDYRPNVDAVTWFCAEILPRVRQEVPAARLVIVGQKPAPSVQALARTGIVEVTGLVPDVRPYVTRAALYIAPLRMGSGTRLKLLEAMALAKPIVCTTLGAEGLAAEPGRDLVLADSPTEMSRAIVALLRDPARRAILGENARRLVAARYDWRQIVPRFEDLYTAASGQ